MIAFDNRQSKLHHPPRVLLYAILRRKRKRGGRVGGLRGRDGESQWVGGEVGVWGEGGRRKKAKTEDRGG